MSMQFHVRAARTVILATLATATVSATPIVYSQTDLVSDIRGRAANYDPNLVNPWGIALTSRSPFWVSDNGTGVATLYNGSGTPLPLVVSIPAPGGGTSAPTGQVANETDAFGGDRFLFATEDGTLAGWRGALGTTAETLLDNSGAGAVYKGVAIGTVGTSTYAYVADFHNNRIDVLPNAGAPMLPGSFTDPSLPSGYAPFNIQNLNGELYVAYAHQEPGSDDEMAGPGLGFVSVFDLNGNFLRRFASQGALNAPWGMAVVPMGFGLPAGDILIGNFGDGTINAYTATGTLVGPLTDMSGNPLVNDGLWGITFGNGAMGGRMNSLYLTAGLDDETHGLFARIDAVPEPATFVLGAAGLACFAIFRRRRRV